MTSQDVRAFTAAIILAGQYAEGDAVNRDIMVQEAIKTTDALLEGLNDMEPLNKRVTEYFENRRKKSEATDKLLAERGMGLCSKDRYTAQNP